MQILDVYKEPYVQTPLIVNTKWARENRTAAVALTQSLKKASQIGSTIRTIRPKLISILAAYTGVGADVCAELLQNSWLEEQQALGHGLVVQAAGLENILQIDRALGASADASRPFDLTRYYDPSFLTGR